MIIDIEDIVPTNFTDSKEVITAYRKDLQNFITALNEADPNDKIILKRFWLKQLEQTWYEKLGFNADTIKKDIQDLMSPKIEFTTSFSLKEALDYYKENKTNTWLVPHLLRRAGLFILAGEPKAGKSLLSYFLIYAVTVSGNLLGRPVKTGKVLFVQLEEPNDTVGERLFFSGFGDEENEEASLVVNFTDRLQVERKFDLANDIQWLIDKIVQGGYSLTIIDGLRASTKGSDASENSGEFGKLVYALQSVFTITNTCGVAIHHMNKENAGNKKASIIQRLAGHTSIPAASDGILALTSEETEEGRLMTLKTLPRQGTSLCLKYFLRTEEGGMWKLEKVFEDTPINHPYTTQILRFLANNPGNKFTGKQLAKELETLYSDEEFRKCLTYLQNSQIISHEYKNKTFVFSLDKDSLWLVNPSSVKDMINSEVIVDANQLLRCKTKREVRFLVDQWDEARQKKAYSALYSTERERIRGLLDTWEFKIGEEVVYAGTIYLIEGYVNKEPSFRHNQYYLTGVDTDVFDEIDLYRYVENDDEVESLEEIENYTEPFDSEVLGLAVEE